MKNGTSCLSPAMASSKIRSTMVRVNQAVDKSGGNLLIWIFHLLHFKLVSFYARQSKRRISNEDDVRVVWI